MNTAEGKDLRQKAVGAMKAAVANVVQEHLRNDRPLAVWRHGKIVMVPPQEATGVREDSGPYESREQNPHSLY